MHAESLFGSWLKCSGCLILNGKPISQSLFCLYEEIYFILKFQFSFVMYIYIIFKLSYLADTFIQINLEMRTIEAIKTKKRAIICNKVLY